MIVFLHASTNNRADTVLQLFTEATTTYNIPSRVRSDQGLENIEVARFMIHMRGINRGSIITEISVHNQRIERLWREVNRVVVSRFLNIFLFLESNGAFNPDDEMHLFCLHVVYMPLINSALQELTEQWNNHPLSSETNYSPRQLWVQGMLELRNSNLTAVTDVVNNEPEIENLDEYGVEEDGPVPNLYSESVSVPESHIHLSEENERTLQHGIAAVPLDDNGISAYAASLAVIVGVFPM